MNPPNFSLDEKLNSFKLKNAEGVAETHTIKQEKTRNYLETKQRLVESIIKRINNTRINNPFAP